MARKTFISYKYSESRDLRDRIIEALGEDATYYQGETSDSPDMTDLKTNTIKESLKDMIYGSSVTIVIISPNMIKSKWIDWEISYSLKEISRDGRTSKTNGVVCVIQKAGWLNDYSWIKSNTIGSDGHNYWTIDNNFLYPIIYNNRFNRREKEYSCKICNTFDDTSQSYMSVVNEADFLASPDHWIENAFNKSKSLEEFIIQKEI